MPRFVREVSITAQNTFSDAIGLSGNFSFSLSGTWVATVHLQRSRDDGTTWNDVGAYTTNTEDAGYEPAGGMLYRVGVKTGNFTSGTIVAALYK